MNYKRTTQVPNIIFDRYLPALTFAELKILLVVIRQTYGWIDKRTGRRKTKDRISHSLFIRKTGLSRRVISPTIASLISKGLIEVKDQQNAVLASSRERKGKSLYYSPRTSTQTDTRTNRILHIGSFLERVNKS